ncbi:MAG: hypothetical protein ACT4N4_00825 [Rhodospirillales bacterium]
MTVFLQMTSALMEPVGLIGYLLCGLLLPRLWLALSGAAGWAVLMNVWDAAQEKARYAVSGSELMVSRFAAALLVAAAAYYALNAWRERRAAGAPAYYAPWQKAMPKHLPMVAADDEPPYDPRV